MGLIGSVSKLWRLERSLFVACQKLEAAKTAEAECARLKIVIADVKLQRSYDFDEG